MAIFYSDQYQDAYVDIPPTVNYGSVVYGSPHILQFSYTQVANGSIGDLVYLVKVPPVCEILMMESVFRFSAWAASTTIDIGFLSYKTPQGATVAADDNGLLDGLDVDAAGWWFGGATFTSTATLANNSPIADI